MNKDDKELLLKDLSTRLPYGVMVKTPYNNAELIGINGIVRRKGYTKETEYIDVITDKQTYPIRYVKPYLRPMSSMAEEEKLMYEGLMIGTDNVSYMLDVIDWLNAHHFDYRGLIEKGLAIEAHKGMYK